MSRAFRFDITITGLKNEVEKDRVYDAALSCWEFQAPDTSGGNSIYMTGIDQINSGEEPADVAERIAETVFARLGRKVEVTIDSTYMDNSPDETFKFGVVSKK